MPDGRFTLIPFWVAAVYLATVVAILIVASAEAAIWAGGGGGGTYGLNAPPGTAEATGLSEPSAATEETPNTQSSTRMPRSAAAWSVRRDPTRHATELHRLGTRRSRRLCSQLRGIGSPPATMYRRRPAPDPSCSVVSVETAPSTVGSGGIGARASAASAATLSWVTLRR